MEKIRSRILSWFKPESFLRQVTVLTSGTAVAQALPILASPLLTRLYSPDDFGFMVTYLACLGVVAVIATGGYELAITIPKSNGEAASLTILSIGISAAFCCFLYVFIFFLGEGFASFIEHPELTSWLYLLPISAFGVSMFRIIQFWCNRMADYKIMATGRVLQAAVTVSSNLTFGFFYVFGGMIFGNIIGQLSSIVLLFSNKWKEIFVSISSYGSMSLSQIAKKYSNFPLNIAPSHLIGVGSQQIPVLVIGAVYSPSVLGYYYLAERLIYLPSSLVANAIGDVYRQRISVAYSENGRFTQIYINTLKSSAFLVAPLFAFLYFFSPIIFEVAFGETWRTAGEYAQIICLMSFFQFIFLTVDKGAIIVGATRYIFFWQLLRLIFTATVCFLTTVLSWNFSEFLLVYTSVITGLYLMDIFVEWRLSYGSKNRN